MSNTQDQMDNLTQANLEGAGMWSGLDDRGTAVWVLFDCTVVADPKAVLKTEREGNFALALAKLLRPSNAPRWHLVQVVADAKVGAEVWVSAEYLSYDTAPLFVRVSQSAPINPSPDCYPVRVVQIEPMREVTIEQDLPY